MPEIETRLRHAKIGLETVSRPRHQDATRSTSRAITHSPWLWQTDRRTDGRDDPKHAAQLWLRGVKWI